MAVFPRLSCLAPALVLAAGLLGPPVPASAQQVGINSAVNPDATGVPPGAQARRLVVGQEVLHNEHISTGGQGQTQVLFLDESAMTVGPNSDVVIDNFVYDPNSGTGQLAMSTAKGVMRFVGGKLSKNENAVTLRTPAATIGIRGGVFLMNLSSSGKLDVVFLYGKGLTVTGNCGAPAACPTQTIIRPGFAVSVAGAGAAPSSPAPAPADEIAGTLAALSGQSGKTGGSSHPPTDASVANSGIGDTISGNVAASVQQAAQNTPPPSPPPVVSVGTLQSSLSVNTASPQGSSIIADAQQNPTPPGTPVGGTPVGSSGGVGVSGLVKIVAAGSDTGFIDQSSNARIPFTGTLDNGTATGTAAGGTVFTLSPLVAGATTNVTATATTASIPATGTAFLAADGDFFFANLTAGGSSGDKIFVLGGVPVQQGFFAATPATQFLAFNVQPDFTLGGSGTQTIPFLPSFAGGTTANAVVSPLYVATAPNQVFGSFNPNSNPTGGAPHLLQASLAIDGAGAGQTAALSILTGSFFTSSDTGSVAVGGPYRGTFLAGGTSPLTHINSGIATVPDANGNTLFGGSAIDGFVLDSNSYDTNLNLVQQNATAFTIGPGTTSTPYALNQPVLAAALPPNVGGSRSTLNEQGFFGGIMTNGAPFAYVLAGAVALGTDPSNNSLFAEFGGVDPFTSRTTGISTLLLPFGTISGRNYSRSTFIDDNIFAAAENATQGVQLTSTSGATTTYPTFVSGVTPYPALGLVTSGTVPGAADSLFSAAGATMCACQYLQWGYWQANIPAVNNGGATNTVQSSYINTWVAGTPTVNMPTTGTASFNGAAIGTVNNNGATYLTAGAFNNTYNFGTGSGTVTIRNFDVDNKTFSGRVLTTGGSNIYGGQLNGVGSAGNITGTAGGLFYGPGAAETGGSFYLHATSGAPYLASGIFAGKQ